MVIQNYQIFIKMTSNMIYIVGLKCPHKIHLNTQCGGADYALNQILRPSYGPVFLFHDMIRDICTYRVLQTIQLKLILLCVWAEPAVLGGFKTALKFKYEI